MLCILCFISFLLQFPFSSKAQAFQFDRINDELHGVHKVFPQSNGWTRDTGGPEECPAEAGGAAQRLSSSMPFNPNADVDPNIGAAPYQTRYPLTIQTQHRLWMRPL